MDKKYYIGFDIGTDSIGWATTDPEYNLLKTRGQDFWGVYLFDEAKTSETRRANRTSRRRTARRRQRIKLLQELFAQEIAKEDFCFFERLNNSKYNVKDKNDGVAYRDCLFHDEAFGDKEYFKNYPTIYRLRAAFLDAQRAKEIKDIRLLYLAVAHIIKNRGHFLFEGQQFSVGNKDVVLAAFSEINEILTNIDENAKTLSFENIDEALKVLCGCKLTKSDKERRLKLLLEAENDKTCNAIIKAIVGLQVNVKNLFGEEEPQIKSFCFDDAGFETEKLKDAFGEDEYALICETKAIYDWAVLSQILKNHKYLSEAMCEKYDMHAADLELLKTYVKGNFGKEKYDEVFSRKPKINWDALSKLLGDNEYLSRVTCAKYDEYNEALNSLKAYVIENFGKEKYNDIFNQKPQNNYAAYVGKDRNRSFCHVSKDDFYKYLRSFVTDEEILKRMDEGTFLQKQRSNANGVIPYQVQLAELERILNNASDNFPFLNDVSDGMSVKEKICSLLTFRIPYYVGPLNTAHMDKGFAWVKKYDGAENVKVTPWNFDKVVDKQASEDEFINRMTSKCTYLVGEDVLPKQSLLYSEFAFLNELNNVTFKGRRLDKQAREVIVDYAKNNNRKITLKVIADVLAKAGLIEQNEKAKENFAGIDGEIKSGFSTLRFFKRLFGDNFDREQCETIVRWFTVMGNKTDAAERARREFKFDEATTKQLKGLNCSGWGRLSKEFLDGNEITTVDDNGEILTIIQAMRETGCNLMELMSSKFGFESSVNKFNDQYADDKKVTYKTIEDLYCSPSVKRAIWRTVCLAKEIEKVQRCAPSRIFIEMARGDDKNKKRTKSRKEQLLELYKACKADILQWVTQEFIDKLENVEDTKLLSDKLYLYYIQMGRCAYTGRPISIEEAFNTNVCDIDHIYPQSKIKDDSIINNKVLCYKTANAAKGDGYPIAHEIREKMLPIWTVWHNKKFISDEKFKRLTRSTPLSGDELADFINRQLVETRQSTKEVAKILKRMYPNADVVYSKARNVVDFKNKINKNRPVLVKVREINDLHHAKDAYLNIVVGNVYYTKFNRDAAIFLKNNNADSYNMDRLFEENIKNAWDLSYKQKVVSVANRNICKVVRFTSEGEGKLFDATLKTKGANDKLIPLKRNCPLENTADYGGYDNATTAYFSLVRSVGKKGKVQLSIEAIPVYIDLLGKDKVLDYLKNTVGIEQPQILIEKIKINSLLKLNGAYVWLRGKTNDSLTICNANQMVLDSEMTAYVKRIVSYNEKRKEIKDAKVDETYDKISKTSNLTLYNALLDKLTSHPYINFSVLQKQAEFLKEKRDVFCELSVENQCALLLEILHLMQCNSTTSNLSLLGGNSTVGKLTCNKKLSETGECLLITQSPTGYYKNIVNLTAYYRQ